MPKFRERPIEITAIRLRHPTLVKTIKGEVRGEAGDWLLTNIFGQEYVLDDEHFRAAWEPVGEAAHVEWEQEIKESP